MGRILEEMSSKSQLHMFFIGIILGIIVNNVYLTLPKYLEVDEVSRKIENRVEIMEKQIAEIENAPPPEIKCPEIQIPERLEEIITQEKPIKYEKPSSLFKNINEVLIIDEFSAISAWDKSVPSEYESVDKLYSEDKCDCGGGFQYSEGSTVDFNSTTKRRNSDFKSYMKNHIFEYVKSPLHVTGANTPIEFVSAGYEIAPDEIFSPHIVIKLPESTTVKLILETTAGDFLIDGEPIDLKKERKMSVQKANKFFEKVQYKSKFYDARAIKDIVKISVIEDSINYQISFPVTIKRLALPLMTYRTGDSINDRVTILTKTLFRYPCLYRFLDSVQAKYPDMTVIVADDNPDDTFEVISKEKYPNVKQYKMPAEEGWFAGRALAISQVRTDYFVWCDDDFVFYEESDMEYMVDVLDKSGFDVVGGGVDTHQRNAWQSSDFIEIKTSPEGYCYTRKPFPTLMTLPGFDNCYVVDIILNFFMARTNTAGTVRMDPNFNRQAHPEYFVDSLGRLRVAWCGKASIHHVRYCPKNEHSAELIALYKDRRQVADADKRDFNMQMNTFWYYRNHMKCKATVSLKEPTRKRREALGFTDYFY